MRYYEVYQPHEKEPNITTNVRGLSGLPQGTHVYRTITDRDGSLIEQIELPIKNGKVEIAGQGKHKPKIWYG